VLVRLFAERRRTARSGRGSWSDGAGSLEIAPLAPTAERKLAKERKAHQQLAQM
jgi:hypothetical protein